MAKLRLCQKTSPMPTRPTRDLVLDLYGAITVPRALGQGDHGAKVNILAKADEHRLPQ